LSPHRPRRSAAQLRDSYAEAVDALGSQFEQLEAAAAQFDPELDEQALTAAWDSKDPIERNQFGLLLGCFERTYMLLMDMIVLAVKLATRAGAIEDRALPGLQVLSEQKVISREARAAIEDQRRVRNTSQHLYVELSLTAFRSAVRQQIDMTPGVISSVAAWTAIVAQATDDQAM
jgi:hypothetical protein